MCNHLAAAFLHAAIASVSGFPNYLPCSRIVKIGQAVMVGLYKGDSTAASIRLDKVDCGGTIMTGTDYAPIITGIPTNPFLAGEYKNPCIQVDGSPAVPSLMYLIDVTDKSYNPFPGANFTEGVHFSSNYISPLDQPQEVKDGKVPLYTPCPSRSSGLTWLSVAPYALPSPSIIRFSEPGVATIRLAWSHGPQYGVNVVENCTYTVVVP